MADVRYLRRRKDRLAAMLGVKRSSYSEAPPIGLGNIKSAEVEAASSSDIEGKELKAGLQATLYFKE